MIKKISLPLVALLISALFGLFCASNAPASADSIELEPFETLEFEEGVEEWDPVTPDAPPSELLGDINLDGNVNIADAMLLFQHSMMSDLYPIRYKGNVDFTKDGSLNLSDAMLLFQYSMMPDLYPIA